MLEWVTDTERSHPTMALTPTPTPWDAVMAPLAESALWIDIRQAASRALVADLHAAGDYDSGISSSDINHRIFGAARWIFANAAAITADYPVEVLARLAEEAR
jgi:hypothetical protein